MAATALLSPIWYPVLELEVQDRRWDITRHKASEICAGEVSRLPQTIPVDNLLDETAGLNSDDIIHLLTTVKLGFVEVKVSPEGFFTAYQDRYGANWRSPLKGGYAHLELGDVRSDDCFYPKDYPEPFFSNWLPVKPRTCLRATYLANPTAKSIVVEAKSALNPDLSTWVLKKRDTGVVVAGVTDAYRQAKYPYPVPRWDRREWPDRCESGLSGYGLLLDRVSGSKQATEGSDRWVMSRRPLEIVGIPPTLAAVKQLQDDGKLTTVKTSDGPYVGDWASLKNRQTWSEAYAAGVKQGAWVHGNSLIVPGTNTIYDIQYQGLNGKWGTTTTQLIFVHANAEARKVVFFGFDFQGQLLWSAQPTPLTTWTDSYALHFEPEYFEMIGKSLLVHGNYGHSVGIESRRPWTIRLPLSDLTELQNRR